jgi:hypothetical protein
MTPKQKQLARNALGLPNERKQSYRNRFVLGNGSTNPNRPAWKKMVSYGHAIRSTLCDGQTVFLLTHVGAKTALNRGETLCPEDFPT